MENQVEKLLDYLDTVEPRITQLVAGKVLGIERLASRIWDLRSMGYVISRDMKRDHSGQRYTEYTLLGVACHGQRFNLV